MHSHMFRHIHLLQSPVILYHPFVVIDPSHGASSPPTPAPRQAPLPVPFCTPPVPVKGNSSDPLDHQHPLLTGLPPSTLLPRQPSLPTSQSRPTSLTRGQKRLLQATVVPLGSGTPHVIHVPERPPPSLFYPAGRGVHTHIHTPLHRSVYHSFMIPQDCQLSKVTSS